MYKDKWKKYKQYKTFEDAFIDFEKKINENHDLEIKIILEEYCEYGYLDNFCKIYLLCEYKYFIIKKYL